MSMISFLMWFLPELRELVKIHGTRHDENEEPLSYDEVLIVKVMVYSLTQDAEI